MSEYYDRKGRPISMSTWSNLFNDMDYRRIGLYKKDGIYISTVWLGLDHRYRADMPHEIFETLASGGLFEDEEMRRYATEEDAIAGHDQFVKTAEDSLTASGL